MVVVVIFRYEVRRLGKRSLCLYFISSGIAAHSNI